MTHRNNDRPFHMSVADAKDIKEGIEAYCKPNGPDRFEYKASNDAEITFGLDWNMYSLEMIDVTRTYGVKLTFDELDDITIEEEFIRGQYDWILTIYGMCNGNRVYKRIMLVDEDRRGEVIA